MNQMVSHFKELLIFIHFCSLFLRAWSLLYLLKAEFVNDLAKCFPIRSAFCIVSICFNLHIYMIITNLHKMLITGSVSCLANCFISSCIILLLEAAFLA